MSMFRLSVLAAAASLMLTGSSYAFNSADDHTGGLGRSSSFYNPPKSSYHYGPSANQYRSGYGFGVYGPSNGFFTPSPGGRSVPIPNTFQQNINRPGSHRTPMHFGQQYNQNQNADHASFGRHSNPTGMNPDGSYGYQK